MYTVAFETLGCRLNQAETAILQNRFAARGYKVVASPRNADLYVLHTCTLTEQAGAKSRRRLRAVIRQNPDACVAAIGCHAQTDADDLARIPGVDFVVGTADKLRLDELIESPVKLPRALVVNGPAPTGSFTIEGSARDILHTRANLKVQEGCDFVCAFCIIPRTRGRARSRDFVDLGREARVLAAAGHREVVITGVNIGTYRDHGHTLADVVSALEDIDGIARVRLSSIEPTTIEDELIEKMARGGKLCSYLHVPLQSGDSATLARMRRRYDAGDYERCMRDAVARVPGIALGTDVIVGFPGEDGAAFGRTCELVSSLPFVNTHVFSFSARPRTSAVSMHDAVVPAEIRRRRERLHRLGMAKRHEVASAWVGRDVRVLFERPAVAGIQAGFADNYLRVVVRTDADLWNRVERVRVTGIDCSDGDVVATGCLLTSRASSS